MIKKKEYLKMNGRIYEVTGRDSADRPICVITDLREIPEDKPLEKPKKVEEPEKPKRGRKAKE